MGKIKQGILGGFANKVGTVVGSSWKGIAVMRSMPLSVANPKTTAQVSNRDKFAQVVKNGQQLLSSVVQPNFNPQAKYMSGYNLFVKLNKDLLDNGIATNYGANIIVAKGDLSCVIDEVVTTVRDGKIIVKANEDLQNAKDRNTDKLYACLSVFPKVDCEVGDIECVPLVPAGTGIGTRSQGKSEFAVPEINAAGKYIYLHVFYRSADGKITSDAKHFGIDDVWE